MVTEDWSNEQITNRANKIIGEVQLRKYGKFIESYTKKLQTLEETFIEGNVIFGEDPINVKLIRQENADILDLIDTDNKILNKIVSVLAALCVEVRERKEEANSRFYNALLIFGEECDSDDQKISQMATSNYLPLLQDLSCFVNRCHQIVTEIIQQLAVIYTTSPNNQIINSTNLHFEDMMDHLGDMLVVLITIDKLIGGIENVRENWQLYKRLIHTVQLDVSKEKLMMFESITKELEATLLNGKIFQNALDKLQCK